MVDLQHHNLVIKEVTTNPAGALKLLYKVLDLCF